MPGELRIPTPGTVALWISVVTYACVCVVFVIACVLTLFAIF